LGGRRGESKEEAEFCFLDGWRSQRRELGRKERGARWRRVRGAKNSKEEAEFCFLDGWRGQRRKERRARRVHRERRRLSSV
jgi:hypothetical protein